MATPIWWFALFILVSNDLVLKHFAVFPQVLSGKLSDFAGLVVLPLLVCGILGLQNRASRVAVFVAIGVAFSAMKLFAPVAAVVEHATAMIGLPWSIQLDPIDLIALVALPFAYRYATRGFPFSPRAAVILGGISCLASGVDPGWGTRAFIVNRTGSPIVASVRFIRADLDCAKIAGRAQRALGIAAFSPGRRLALDANATLALDETAHATPTEASKIFRGDCSAAVVEIEGLPDTLIFWNAARTLLVPPVFEDGETPENIPAEQMIELFDRDGKISLEGSTFEIAPLQDAIAEDACESSSTVSERFEWSALNVTDLHRKILDIDIQGDGCTAFTLEDPIHRHLTLCAPAPELPFAPGDYLTINTDHSGNPLVEGRWLRMSRTSTRAPHAELFAYTGPAPAIPDLKATLLELGCSEGLGGYRNDCGGFVVPSGVELESGIRLIPGTAIDLPSRRGKRSRIVIGRAEHVAVGAHSCEPGRNLAGAFVDLVMVTEEEDR